MDTRAWPRRFARTTLLSATLVALGQAEDAIGPRPRQTAVIEGSADLSTTTFTFPTVTEDTAGTGFSAYGAIDPWYSESNFSHERGIAIIGADTSHGHYEYSITVASPTWIPVGAVSQSS